MKSNFTSLRNFFEDQQCPLALEPTSITRGDVTLHIYGVFHGLTGGTNRRYRSSVNQAIARAKLISKNPVLAEKSFSTIYRGVDVDVMDWSVIPLGDAFKMNFHLFAHPLRWFAIIKIMAIEFIRKNDKFGKNGVYRPCDLGGSLLAHKIPPQERRLMFGFPLSQEYLVQNVNRMRGEPHMGSLHFIDPDYEWLGWAEPYINIPLRSIYMLEFSFEYARLNRLMAINLFVGQSHEGDMEWYANNTLEDDKNINQEVLYEVARIIELAKEMASNGPSIFDLIAFRCVSLAGAIFPILLWYGIFFLAFL